MRRFKKILLTFGVASLLCGLMPAVAAGAPVETSGDDFVVRLGGIAFDPLAGEPTLTDGWQGSAGPGEDLHLIQFNGPLPAGALAALQERGFEPVQYIHPHTYVVWGRRAARGGLELGGSIRWAGDFAPAYRVLPQWRELPADPVDARVLIYRGADPDSVVQRIAALGGALVERSVVTEEFELAGFTLPGDRLQAAAGIPGVYTIQLASTDGGSRAEVASQISAGNVDGGNSALPGYQAWLTTVGLDGTGVVTAVVDVGTDENHPDLLNRMLPCVGDTCNIYKSEHGTHVAGIIAGDASSAELSPTGFLRGLGTAPGSKIFEQDWRLTYTLPGGMLKLITESYANGAVISNNSWGTSATAFGYDLNTLLVDAGVRDADPETGGSQPMIFIQAIENGSGGVSTQGTPDDGKNIFTVGSTPALADSAGNPATNINDLAFSTGHGPALDGRTLPQMVAPGCYVESPVAELAEGFVHAARCGASMAAAHVSGATALFVERYRGLAGSADPSPALVKAAFLPVAHDLEGNLDPDAVVLGHRPDSKQGWGRMNLAAVVDPPDPVLYFDQTHVFDFTGQEWMRVVTQANPAEPMRIMLVWTDAPGHGLGGPTPAWNNDLDLVVEADAQTYLGNDFGIDGFSTTGGTADGMNNAEGVFLQTVTGNATIKVQATDINSNGVPHFGDRTDQDFAVACYNCALAADFALMVDTAPLPVCSSQSTDLGIQVEQLAGFGDLVTLSAVNVPAGASASFSSNPVTPPANPVMTLDPGTAVDGDYTIEIHGDSPMLNRSVSLNVNLRTAAPGLATLTAPLDAAIDVFPRPLLDWDAVSWAELYMVEIATAPDFLDIVYSAVERADTHTVGRTLKQQTDYYWRVRAHNACGYGLVSGTFSFTTVDVPDLLLVDDDYDLPNEQPEYTAVLGNLGVSYDIWDVWAVHIGGEPDAATLALYDQVIWFTGKEEVYPGPDDASERILPEWLDRGACMLISSTDYVLQRGGVSDFMAERLGVASAVEDTGMTTVTGAGAAFGGLAPLGPLGLVNANPDYRDTISPDVTAELAFVGDVGDAGVNKDGLWYRTSFLGFGVESAGTGDKDLILDAFLTWCAGLAAIDGDGDGVLNGDDCVDGDANAWSAPQPITDLALGKGAVGFTWSVPVSGSGSSYDVLRSTDVTDFYNADCVAADVTQTSIPEDNAIPAPGQLFYYLVGARSECGMSTLGNNLGGTPRYGTACDAEKVWW